MFMLRVRCRGALVAWSALGGQHRSPGTRAAASSCSRPSSASSATASRARAARSRPISPSASTATYTPTVMASLMWNHAPDMWAAMKKQGIAKGQHDAGVGGRPVRLLRLGALLRKAGRCRPRQAGIRRAKHCAECHGITTSIAAGAPPVAKWESLADPDGSGAADVEPRPQDARGVRPEEACSGRRSPDRNSPTCWCTCRTCRRPKRWRSNFQFPPSDSRRGAVPIEGLRRIATPGSWRWRCCLRNQTLTDIAVDMWNHQPSMKQPPPTFSPEEMRQIIGYIWARQYFRGDGNADRGKKVFAEKNCATCHNDPSSGAPKLAKGKDAIPTSPWSRRSGSTVRTCST